MKTLSALALLLLCASGYAQMIPGQSIKLDYDTRGNRIVRKPYQSGSQNKKGDEIQTEESFTTLYPNPATSHITILLQECDSTAADITIFDINGKPVMVDKMKEGSETRTFTISHLSPGTYQVEVKTLRGTETKSFIHL